MKVHVVVEILGKMVIVNADTLHIIYTVYPIKNNCNMAASEL